METELTFFVIACLLSPSARLLYVRDSAGGTSAKRNSDCIANSFIVALFIQYLLNDSWPGFTKSVYTLGINGQKFENCAAENAEAFRV